MKSWTKPFLRKAIKMDPKQILTITGLLAVMLIFCTAVYSQDDIVRMDNTTFDNPQRTAAVFDHDIHNEAAELEDDCALCHHVFENGALLEDESSEDSACGDCHGLKPASDNAVSLRKAFHSRCRSCHFELKQGPVLCGECHVK